jgi:hypothetical protein
MWLRVGRGQLAGCGGYFRQCQGFAGLISWRTRFDLGSIHLRFVVDQVVQAQMFLSVLSLQFHHRSVLQLKAVTEIVYVNFVFHLINCTSTCRRRLDPASRCCWNATPRRFMRACLGRQLDREWKVCESGESNANSDHSLVKVNNGLRIFFTVGSWEHAISLGWYLVAPEGLI